MSAPVSTRNAKKRTRGLTLVEIAIALSVVATALLALMSGIVAAMRLDQSIREQALAKAAATTIVESMRQTTFSQIYATYNSSSADDPAGAGTASGANFAVSGLVALSTDADGMPGLISFPETNGALSEMVVDTQLGMPSGGRDLNGDGDATDTNVSATYTILPVRIQIAWQGVNGASRYEITTYMGP